MNSPYGNTIAFLFLASLAELFSDQSLRLRHIFGACNTYNTLVDIDGACST